MGTVSDSPCECRVCGAVSALHAPHPRCVLCGGDSAGYALQDGRSACLSHARGELLRRTRAHPPWGARYGVMRVVGFARSTGKHAWWWLRCSCGALDEARADNVRAGRHTSCGEGQCRANLHRLVRRLSTAGAVAA